MSGWGDDEVDLRDDLLQRWSIMLEHWDGRDRWDPSGDKPRPSKELCKLVRCVSHLYTHYTILYYIHTLYYTILYTHYTILYTHYTILYTHYTILYTHYTILYYYTHYTILYTHYTILYTHYTILYTHTILYYTHTTQDTYTHCIHYCRVFLGHCAVRYGRCYPGLTQIHNY